MPAGRPTKYRKEFCELLIKHMEDGGSFDAFVSTCRADKTQMYRWLDRHPEFRHAKERGELLAYAFWERKGREIMLGELKSSTETFEIVDGRPVATKAVRHPVTGNASAYIFMMKNRYKWRDKVDVEHSGSIGGKEFEKMSEEELRNHGKKLSEIIDSEED